MTFSRTETPSEASYLAFVDVAVAASPSVEPTASVTGRLYQRYPYSPAAVQSRITPSRETRRSQNGILIEIIRTAPQEPAISAQALGRTTVAMMGMAVAFPPTSH